MGVNMGVRIEKGIYGHWVNCATKVDIEGKFDT